MRILAIDTSLSHLSVACRSDTAAGDVEWVHDSAAASGAHAERLMPMIAGVLTQAGLAFSDIDRLAITLGPGTFTGVRTAIAAARAFRLSAGVEVVGTTSLAVMAHQAFRTLGASIDGRPLLVTTDARRGRIYAELFATCALDPRAGPAELEPSEIAQFCANLPAVAVGTGLSVPGLSDTLATAGIEPRAELGELTPLATDLAELALALTPLETIKPIYIRPPDAKPPASSSIARSP